jgi:GNAT superfamily N-acetyltransferase
MQLRFAPGGAAEGWAAVVTAATYTEVEAAGDRAWNAMNGTLPSHRGRGLAALAKAHALAAMAGAGITRRCTANDGANAPMLAVNQRLGYRGEISTWSARRPAAR